MSRDEYREAHRDVHRTGLLGISITVWVIAVVILLIVGIGGFQLAVRPYVVEQQREQNQASQQYVETQQEELLHLYEEWTTAGQAQRGALEDRMRVMAERIPDDDVPDGVKEVLNQ